MMMMMLDLILTVSSRDFLIKGSWNNLIAVSSSESTNVTLTNLQA